MSHILITGGSSYLGQHLVPLVIADGHTVDYTYHQNKPSLPGTGHQLDIRDETAVRQLILSLQPEIIIHLAGSNRGPEMAAVIRQGWATPWFQSHPQISSSLVVGMRTSKTIK